MVKNEGIIGQKEGKLGKKGDFMMGMVPSG